MNYTDEITRAIYRRFAPDLAAVLSQTDVMEMQYPSESVRVPLVAGVEVFYKNDLAAFAVRGKLRDPKRHWLCGEMIYSTRLIDSAHDRAMAITHCFEESKAQMIRAVVDGELTDILKN